jgi:hypothetical protein
MTEYDEQQTVFEYAHGYAGNLDPRLRMLHAVENAKGNGRPPAGSAESAGVPDMFLAVSIAPHHGLYIELKTQTGKVAANQKRWQKALRLQGYASEICYGADGAIETLRQYLDGRLPPF